MNDIEVIGLFIGILITIGIVKVLKNIIKQPRPSQHANGYGMPSSRGAVIFFIAFYILYCCSLSKITWLIVLILAVSILSLKYLAKEHSLLQLLVGATIGMILAYGVLKIINLYKKYI